MIYKQDNEITLDDGKKLKSFFWKVSRWGKNENTGKAYADVEHWFVNGEKDTSNIHERTYTKTMAGSPTLNKVELFLLTLPQYTGSNEQ